MSEADLTSEAKADEARAELDFARAEYDTSGPSSAACGFCQRSIERQYWQIGARVACATCRSQLEQAIAHSQSPRAFWGSVRLGVLAAALGSVGWIIVTKVTGYELGILAVAIGFLVGKAVRKGAGGIGGRRYQWLAVLLTYAAISLASIPAIFDAIKNASHSPEVTPAPSPSLGTFLQAWLYLLAFALASPFLGLPDNFMGLVILGIGLYEAWKFTAAVPFQILGPFTLKAAAPIEQPSGDVSA